MKKTVARWLEDAWYREMYLSTLFAPLSMLYVDGIRLRRWLYRKGMLKSTRLPVPVIVVGNISIGGTGKTPLVIWLAGFLKQQGYNPGVISRGYGGQDNLQPQRVTPYSDARQVGDEPILLAQHCDCPVMIGIDRVAAAQALLDGGGVDIILSDDGLQHYALQRDIEIVVVDGQRRFGNGYCLPVGPLREPPERLREVDLVVVNAGETEGEQLAMQCFGSQIINLKTGEQQSLSTLKGKHCHALAGIGNPQRFFDQLLAGGLHLEPHAFPDHYLFSADEIKFNDDWPVLMTEKDAVKCRNFADENHWYLPISAQLPDSFGERLLQLLRKSTHG